MYDYLPTDDLTKLVTRDAYREAFSETLSASKEKKPPQPLAVAFIDIDHFMAVNDNYGHSTGDAMLKAVSTVLMDMLLDKGIAARYGGDEFAFLLPGMEREGAFLLIERIRSAINDAEFVDSAGNTIQGYTISAGVAAFPLDGRTETELLRKADQALYRAKRAGRNQVRLAYDEKMVPKTAHFTQTQLERLSELAEVHSTSDADLLREALDDLLTKYGVNDIES
jgi:diguanylate cyclase (GGDEF)-like protein